jgi:hypothetical protein
MARGWESKSVEEQLAEAEAARQSKAQPQLTLEQADAQRQRELLLMARNRIVRLLANATNQRYRKLLEQELKALDDKLAA